MRIGIDACCWSNRRGFGRFTRELVGHMVAEHPQHTYTLVVDRATAAGAQFPASAAIKVVETKEQPTEAAAADGARSPGDLWRMARAAAKLDVDVFFFPAVYSFYPILNRVPTVVTFHDAIAEQHPKLIFPGWRSRIFWNLKTWLARQQANTVLTVSESAKRQIISAFNYPAASIRVITEGPGEGFSPMNDSARIQQVLREYQLPADKPLIVYVGGISPHKNLRGLLEALHLLKNIAIPWHMVIVGDYKGDSFFGCYQELIEQRQALGLEGDVTFTGFVPNDHLVALYNASTLVVLPSFNEGFGLPVVEAMACGAAVAASNRGSLPEVLGSAGIYFDPQNSREMAEALAKVLTDEVLRERMRREGLQRSERFSWKTAAAQTIAVFEDMTRGAAKTA